MAWFLIRNRTARKQRGELTASRSEISQGFRASGLWILDFDSESAPCKSRPRRLAGQFRPRILRELCTIRHRRKADHSLQWGSAFGRNCSRVILRILGCAMSWEVLVSICFK